MRCPICGAKMLQNQICQYCHITDEQVINASNKKVKEYRKTDKMDLVHFTTVLPKDVNWLKLLLYTIVLGLIGINHYYINRVVRANFAMISSVLSVVFVVLKLVIENFQKIIILELMFEIVFFAMTINVIMWVFDIINVILKKTKIPVVLAEKENKK